MIEKYLQKEHFTSYEDFLQNFNVEVPDDFNFGYDVVDAIAARTAAKKAKNYAEADRIRDELKAQGITLIDTPQGVKWSRD